MNVQNIQFYLIIRAFLLLICLARDYHSFHLLVIDKRGDEISQGPDILTNLWPQRLKKVV